ncbi:MAG TPA: hypothetical protein VND22_08025 [Actinomycetota bacterium]|nr:hypothetical protein [Actinomycetota bacterium]
MTTYVFTLANEDDDDAEEIESEIESDEVHLTVRVVEGDDEPVVFEYRVTPLGIEALDT